MSTKSVVGMVAVLCACAMTIACGCGGDDDDDASDDGVIPDDDAPDDDDTEHDDDADDDSAVTDDDTGDDDTAPFRPDHDGELDIFSDTDRDGVTDWQERLDGTDPHDPSDATAWHPEITAHPRLWGDAARWLAVKALVEADDPDALRNFNAVKNDADRTPTAQPPGAYDFSYDETNSYTALGAAVAAFILDDGAYAQKAADIGAAFEFRVFQDWRIEEWDQGTIHGGMALVNLAAAYDLLAGFELVDASSLDAMRAAILDYAAVLHDMYVTIPIVLATQNNHAIKFASGLGAVGMLFNDTREAALYVNFALATAPWILFDFQMAPGGGQGEGPNYLDYTLQTFWPFARMYHLFADGEAYPYKTICRARLQEGCTESVEDVADPLVDPRLTELLDWRMNLVMPSGYAVPLDDSNLSCGYFGPAAQLAGRADHAWLDENTRDCALRTSGAAALLLVTLPDRPSALPPDFESALFEPGGQAVLRTGWDEDAFFAALNGEHDKARLSGIGHEQADATSFVLHALGEYFVIDSGYINWSERLRVAGATHHNLVLVDGEGPSLGLLYVFADADAWLDEFTDETAWRSARVYSEYEGASVSRRVAVVGEDYFITEERVAADAPRTFTWQSHMNAGGDTDGTFTPLADGALVERPLAVLRTYLQSLPGPPSFGTRVDEHAASHSVAGTHNVLTADVAADEARFLSLHLVAAEKADLPEVTNASAGELLINVVGGDGYLDAVISSPGGAFEIEPDEDIGTIRSDAELVWVRVDPDAGALIDHQILEGTYFERDP